MAFTASDIKNLREMTGAGMLECKKALTECNGSIEEAEKYLKEKGLAAAAKSSRSLKRIFTFLQKAFRASLRFFSIQVRDDIKKSTSSTLVLSL